MPQQRGKKQKNNLTNMLPNSFKIGNKVLITNDFDTTKNPKLVPNWKGPAEIIDVNTLMLKWKWKNKIKVLNVKKLKHFFKKVTNSEDKEDDAKDNFNQNSDQARNGF